MRDLFEPQRDSEAPLADRMRPRSLSEVIGQQHVLGPGTMLRRLVESGRVPSLVLWGPPGVGKTTIARLLAAPDQEFESLSAVMSGVAELRKVIERARQRRSTTGRRTLLFVDEIHRWSKSQQDALLEAVERGWLTLAGATTENPSFELTRALLSRLRVFVLEALEPDDVRRVLQRALEDARGLAGRELIVEADALDALSKATYGDARRALSALGVAADEAETDDKRIDRARVERALQHRGLLYDKRGEEHFGVVSAFIKSMRGSDPDAAVYYLVRMLEAGEEPRFLLRRMVIFASEDVGRADPKALQVATDAARAFELVGLPEGVLPMTQAAIYLSRAPKDNEALVAYGRARKLVREQGALPVPPKLLNVTSGLSRQRGHGEGYKYPHDLGGFVDGETYLPDALIGARIVEPAPDTDGDLPATPRSSAE